MNLSKIQKILVISLSNIGDVVLTFPVVDILLADFKQAKVDVVVGPKAEPLFEGNIFINKLYVYDKHQPVIETIRWVRELQRRRYDLVVDLRNTMTPLLIFPRYRTPFFRWRRFKGVHMRQKHLDCLKSIYPYQQESLKEYCLSISHENRTYIDELLQRYNIKDQKKIIFCPGAANHNKRWPAQCFAHLADRIAEEYNIVPVFAGDSKDYLIVQDILKLMTKPGFNFCGMTSLIQLAELINRASLLVTNDSAPLHIASYLNKSVIAVFGPGQPAAYGPWSNKSFYLQRNEECPACRNKRLNIDHECIKSINIMDVYSVMKSMFADDLLP